MDLNLDSGVILVTGASGHVGSELCRSLRATEYKFLPIDVIPDESRGVIGCDLQIKSDVSRLFELHPIRAVVHLAGMLPSACRNDPISAAAVNLGGSVELMRQALNAGVKRFVFASSMSGSAAARRAFTGDDPPAPDELYGSLKRAVELIGEALTGTSSFEFVSLRIARVIGPRIKQTSSPWRALIFDAATRTEPIRIPFAPDAKLSLVHVEDVARMLLILTTSTRVKHRAYNSPAETWEARALKLTLEEFSRRADLDGSDDGGPMPEGSRFMREFGFHPQALRERLSNSVLERSVQD